MILPSWEDGMGAKLLLAAILGPAIGLALSGCFGPEHPDYTRYEYLYIDGAFQPPYKEFPTGNARAEWKCFDPRANRTLDCTFVHGGWQYYQYVYRPRR
jgi:hypothetical protein